jgi:hypothetical protein
MTPSKSAALLAAALVALPLAVPTAALAAPGQVAAAGAGKTRLAILDFTLAGSAHPDLARVLADGAAKGAEGAEYQIITQGEVAAILGLDRMRTLLGCSDDQGCLSDLAGALDAERLLSGSLTILERTALVTVRLIDARKGRTLARVSTSLLDATEKELVDAARRLAFEVVTGKRLDTSGVLRIQIDRPGAVVTLDGKEMGRSPLTAAPRVLEGPHAIVVQKEGYVRWSTTVAVPPGGEVPVQVELIPIRLLGEAARSRLWAWAYGSTGVAVVGLAGGLLFKRQADDAYSQYQSATNRTRASDLKNQTQQKATLSKASFAVAGAAAVSAATLYILAARADARAAEEPRMAEPPPAPKVTVTPTLDGVMVSGRF